MEEKIEACLQCCLHSRLAHFQNLPLWILWRLWKSRNLLIFRRIQLDGRILLQQARRDAQEWKTHAIDTDRNIRQGTSVVQKTNRWKKPKRGWLKCNVDSSFVNSQTPSTAGWVLRDEEGSYQGAAHGIGRIVNNSFESEAQGILMAMQHIWSKGFTRVVFEGDCKKVIDTLNRKSLHFDGHNWIRDIWWWKGKFHEVEFVWTNRESNNVADKMAKQRIPFNNSFYFYYYVPTCITMDLHNDYVSSY